MVSFDQLPKEIQQQVIMLAMQGKPPTPDNQNRARMALEQNPQMLMQILKASGLDKEVAQDANDPNSTDDGGGDASDSGDVTDNMDFGPDPNDPDEAGEDPAEEATETPAQEAAEDAKEPPLPMKKKMPLNVRRR